MARIVVFMALLSVSLLGPMGRGWAAELVMFDDPTCVWCQKWLREVGPGYGPSEEGRIAPLRRVNISAQANSGVALKTPVTATPTFVVADDEGREVGRITGYPGADFFYPALGEILKKLPERGSAPRKPMLRETRLDNEHADPDGRCLCRPWLVSRLAR